jgi:hypothetical protein
MSKKFYIVVNADKSNRLAIHGIGTTAAEAIADATDWIDGTVTGLVAEPCTEALFNEVRDNGMPDGWGFDKESGLHCTTTEAEAKTWTVFGDGKKQGTAVAATPEQALREVLSFFGTVVSIDDTYFVDTRLNPGLSEYEVYEGDLNEEPEDIEPLKFDVKMDFAA